MSVEEERMKAKFRPVFREIKAIERKIHQKEGWIFVKHKYTIEELLNSQHHQKIDSYTEKIGDDIQRWYVEGKLDSVEEEYYYLFRNEVEDKLEEINQEIEEREPTWWEKVKGAMEGFIVIIMDNMPEKLRRTLLDNMKDIGKRLGGFISKNKKLLLPN